eukprot:CAMPEP_0206839144 /NCGR_PEP_ID=MMETSP0975-20121206/21274_1 /ASSEMBLY_ACC=CAM_ASM_000399 /TAXON_ID=483370 /ORGANISM="non described non described, Strain CCMP2097" /LENGTH=46 /DNA_ID= /DNA_START= /DNA_END= /DNA_ORIENTATION=
MTSSEIGHRVASSAAYGRRKTSSAADGRGAGSAGPPRAALRASRTP